MGEWGEWSIEPTSTPTPHPPPGSVVRRHRRVAALAGAVSGALGACGPRDHPSALDPSGPGAERIAEVWWWLFGVGAAVYVIVMVALLLALRRRKESRRSRGVLPIVLGGVVLPALVLPALFWLNVAALDELGPPSDDELIIEVVGNRWWWEVRYPDQGILTANQIHVPVGRGVRLRMTSDDVIHSLWVPELNGKIDLLPGAVTTLSLDAAEPGTYWGRCAEFCGIQHAKMELVVVAQTPEDFAEWVDAAAGPPASPATPLARRGRDAFLENGCGACHTIAGTPADGELGPALTDFARRLTIGAGAVPNTPGHLGGWIANSQTIKPGNLMPPVKLEPDELQALIAYLESLE